MNQFVLSRSILYMFMICALWVTGCTDGQPQASTVDNAQPSKQLSAVPLPHDGGELVIGSSEELPSFDPFGETKKEAVYQPYETLTYRGLLTYAADGTLTGGIASDYRVERVNGKPTIVVSLRKGATWSDGQPITVEDIQYTLDTYTRPDYFGVWRQQMHLIEGASPYRSGKLPHVSGVVIDPSSGTVRINLERDDQSFLQALTAPLLPKHQVGTKSIPEIDSLSRGGKLLGAGPFQINELNKDSWSYTAHANYYEGKPRLASVKIVHKANPAEEVKAGSIHWSYVSPDEAAALSTEQGTSAEVRVGAGNGYHFVGFNLLSKSLSDLKIRKALAQAISVDEMRKTYFHEFASEVKSPLAPGSFAYQENQTFSYDVKEAQKILAEKGFTKEKPLVFSLIYPADNDVRQRIVEGILKDWEALPIRIENQALAKEKFNAYLFGGEKVDLFVYAWKYPDDPAQLTKIWHSREKIGELGLNAYHFINPTADQLLDRGQLLLPIEERKKLFVSWQKILMDNVPFIPLVEIQNPYYISTRLHGVDDKIGMRPFANIHTWWLE